MSSDNLTHEILKQLQAGQANIQRDVRNSAQQTNERLAAIEHHMAGFHVALTRHNDDVEDLKDRVARLERRLELSDE